jgi:uncharacterized protein (TIGR02246 family)
MEAGGTIQERKRIVERTKNIDVAQIYQLWNEYADAWRAGDMERWLDLWTEDGIQMPPDAPRNIGKEQIRTANQPGMDQNDYEMTINPDEVRVLGDRAYSHGVGGFKMTPKGGGDTIEFIGKFLTILEKQADGSWKIAIDCFNRDAPPA